MNRSYVFKFLSLLGSFPGKYMCSNPLTFNTATEITFVCD